MNTEDIRKKFTDFRYLASTDNSDILKEFVPYEEAKSAIIELSDAYDTLHQTYLSQVGLYKSLYTEAKKKNEQKFEMVDLGLPSGLKWAKCNLGADTETDYGDYYMFGSTTPDTDNTCDWAHCPFSNGQEYYDGEYFTAHKDEWFNGNILKPEYDAATVNMGEGWRMPTQADLQELVYETTSERVENYNGSGVNGRLFTSKTNGNTLFIPMSGYRGDSDVYRIGGYGYVWSSSLNSGHFYYAWYLDFYINYINVFSSNRYFGQSVRGVYDKKC